MSPEQNNREQGEPDQAMDPVVPVQSGRTDRETGWTQRTGRVLFKVALFILALLLILTLGMMIMRALSLEQLSHFRASLNTWSAPMTFFRLGVLTALIGYWTPINTWLGKRRGWDEAHLARVIKGRWSAATVLLFVELVMIQRLHQPLIDWVVR